MPGKALEVVEPVTGYPDLNNEYIQDLLDSGRTDVVGVKLVTPVSVNGLEEERGSLNNNLIDGFIQLGPSAEFIQQFPYGSRKGGISGIVGQLAVGLGHEAHRDSTKARSQTTFVIGDNDWVPGALYAQSDVMQARADNRRSVLEGIRALWFIFKHDSEVLNPLFTMGEVKHNNGDYILGDVQHTKDANPYTAAVHPTSTTLFDKATGRTVPTTPGFLNEKTEAKEADIRARHTPEEIDQMITAMYLSLTKEGYDWATDGNLSTKVATSIKEYVVSTAKDPLAWRVLYRAAKFAEELTERDDLTKQQLEAERNHIRAEFIQAFAMAKLKAFYHNLMMDDAALGLPRVNQMRWEAFLRDELDIEFEEALKDLDGPYANRARAAAARFAGIGVGSLIILPTQGNDVTRSMSLDGSGEEVDCPAVCSRGQVMPYAAPEGPYPVQISRSLYEGGLMMAGVGGKLDLAPSEGISETQSSLAINGFEAPAKLIRRFIRQGFGFFQAPTLSEMLTEETTPSYSLIHIGEDGATVTDVVEEGEALILTVTENREAVNIRPAIVVPKSESETSGKQKGIRKLFGKSDKTEGYDVTAVDLDEGEMAIAGLAVFKGTLHVFHTPDERSGSQFTVMRSAQMKLEV